MNIQQQNNLTSCLEAKNLASEEQNGNPLGSNNPQIQSKKVPYSKEDNYNYPGLRSQKSKLKLSPERLASLRASVKIRDKNRWNTHRTRKNNCEMRNQKRMVQRMRIQTDEVDNWFIIYTTYMISGKNVNVNQPITKDNTNLTKRSTYTKEASDISRGSPSVTDNIQKIFQITRCKQSNSSNYLKQPLKLRCADENQVNRVKEKRDEVCGGEREKIENSVEEKMRSEEDRGLDMDMAVASGEYNLHNNLFNSGDKEEVVERVLLEGQFMIEILSNEHREDTRGTRARKVASKLYLESIERTKSGINLILSSEFKERKHLGSPNEGNILNIGEGEQLPRENIYYGYRDDIHPGSPTSNYPSCPSTLQQHYSSTRGNINQPPYPPVWGEMGSQLCYPRGGFMTEAPRNGYCFGGYPMDSGYGSPSFMMMQRVRGMPPYPHIYPYPYPYPNIPPQFPPSPYNHFIYPNHLRFNNNTQS